MPISITVQKQELYDDEKKEFIELDKDYTLYLEHSLVSISKWESKWHKPFPYLNTGMSMDQNELLNYVQCMTMGKEIPEMVYTCLTKNDFKAISNYITNPMTATTVKSVNREHKKQILTSELLYYYMFKLGIPKDCEKWHINRLIKLIEIFSVKDANENLSRSEQIARNKAINSANRARFNTKG